VSDELEQLRRQMRHGLADVTVRGASAFVETGVELRLDPVLTARSLMGGVVEVLSDWINGDVHASVDEMVEHFTRLFTAAAYASVIDPAPARPGRTKRKTA